MTHTHTIEFLWARDRPVAETSTDKTPHTQDADNHAPDGFEPAIPASVRPQNHSLDRAAIGFGPAYHKVRNLYGIPTPHY